MQAHKTLQLRASPIARRATLCVAAAAAATDEATVSEVGVPVGGGWRRGPAGVARLRGVRGSPFKVTPRKFPLAPKQHGLGCTVVLISCDCHPTVVLCLLIELFSTMQYRRVMDQIRHHKYDYALKILDDLPHRACETIREVLVSVSFHSPHCM